MAELFTHYLAVEPDGSHRKVAPTYEGIKDGLHDAGFDALTLHGGPDGTVDLYIDDEGMLNGARLNVPVSMFVGIALYGPAVLTGPVDDEGETTLPPLGTASMLASMADRWAEVTFDATIRKGQDITVRSSADSLPPAIVTMLSGDEAEGWLSGDPETRRAVQDRIDLGGDS